MTHTEWIVSVDDDLKDSDELFVGNVRDGEQLIRCEYCKYFNAEPVEEHTPYGFTNVHWACWCDKHTDYDNQKYLEVNTDDFCSWAERKDDEID